MMGVRFTQKTRRTPLISLYHISQEPWKGFMSWYMVFPMNFGYLFDLFGNQWNLPAGVRNCVQSVCIRSYSGPHFPAFGLNTERYSLSLCIQSECGKMQTRITPNADTFHAVRNAFKTLSQ